MKKVRIRGKSSQRDSLYPLGEITREVAISIGKQIVHRLAVGQGNITGDEFGNMFATAVK